MSRNARALHALGTVARGAVAGAVATAAMDSVWYRRFRRGGGDGDFASWEFSTTATDFGPTAPAPARVGKRIADTLGIDIDDWSVAAVNNAVHWMTGISWGVVAGLTAAVLPVPAIAAGVVGGITAWGTSYVLLGAAGIYEPITHYDAATLWKDLSAHLVFGTALGTTLVVLTPARRRTVTLR